MEDSDWLTSKQSKEYLKIKSCDLMHYRLEGAIDFQKKGNSYLYFKKSLDQIKKES